MQIQELIATHRNTALQFLRYALVGVINTMVTLFVILICKSLLGINPWVSNAAGYVAGFINSFIWNKLWVFNSHNKVVREALKFCGGFLICYGLQFLVTFLITNYTALGDMEWEIRNFTLSGYGVATIIGMTAYTLANYVYNRMVTFRKPNA
ncbi:MAG: GtrA family protein [Paramuribaculum sp.]|nr:GtrA family protein [Paramuribaculum sp.]